MDNSKDIRSLKARVLWLEDAVEEIESFELTEGGLYDAVKEAQDIAGEGVSNTEDLYAMVRRIENSVDYIENALEELTVKVDDLEKDVIYGDRRAFMMGKKTHSK